MKLIGSALLLLSGIFLACWFWQMQEGRYRAAHHHSVEAVIVANRVHKEADYNSKTNQYLHFFRSEYLLQYSFNGKVYRCWQAGPLRSLQRSRVEAALGELSPGNRIEVFIDPESPAILTFQITGWQAYSGVVLFAFLTVITAIAGILCKQTPTKPLAVVYLN